MFMNKKISIGAAITLMIVSMALTVSVTVAVAMRQFNMTIPDVNKKQVMYDNVADIDTAVRQYYNGIDEVKLRAALAKGYIDGIGDPYAAYLSVPDYKIALDARAGIHTGSGIEIVMASNEKTVISAVHKDSPADKAGLLKGDVLASVDGVAVNAVNFESIQEKLSGAPKIMLTITRGDASPAFELTASPYTVASVEERLIGSIGYIRLRTFHEKTINQFKAAFTALEEQGATGYVFDLRGNEGGMLEAAVEVLTYLMPRGNYATMTNTKTGEVTEFTAADTYQLGKPSVTLVNGYTTGEAELFAGVLQEFNLTTVIGETTAGKGRVQKYVAMKTDNSAVRLTMGELFLIKGGAIEGKGIIPAKHVALTPAQEKIFDLLTEKDDTQLRMALLHLDSNALTSPESNETSK